MSYYFLIFLAYYLFALCGNMQSNQGWVWIIFTESLLTYCSQPLSKVANLTYPSTYLPRHTVSEREKTRNEKRTKVAREKRKKEKRRRVATTDSEDNIHCCCLLLVPQQVFTGTTRIIAYLLQAKQRGENGQRLTRPNFVTSSSLHHFVIENWLDSRDLTSSPPPHITTL